MGYDGIEDVRQGKYFELDASTTQAARGENACRRSRRTNCSRTRSSKAIASRSTRSHDICRYRLPGIELLSRRVLTRRTDVLGQTAELIWHKDTDLKGVPTPSFCPVALRTATICRTGAIAPVFADDAAATRVRRRRQPGSSASATASRSSSKRRFCRVRCSGNPTAGTRCEHIHVRDREDRYARYQMKFRRARSSAEDSDRPRRRQLLRGRADVLERLEGNRQAIFRYITADGRL